MSDKQRIIDLQRQNKMFRDALTRIQAGCRRPDLVAEDALYNSMPLNRQQPLQGLVGHPVLKQLR